MILRIFWKTRFFYIAICVALITYPPSIFGETTNDNDISEFLLNIVKDIINLKNSLRYVQRKVDNTTSSLERQHSDTAAQLRGHIDTLDSQQSRRLGELSNRLDKSWENTSAEGVIRNERVNVLEHRITNISAETRLDKGSLNATLMTFFTRLFGVGLSPILSQLSQLRRRVDRIRSSFKMVSHNRSSLLRQKNQLFIPDDEEHSEQFYNSITTTSEMIALANAWARTSPSPRTNAEIPALPTAPDIRLVGGIDSSRGWLEVFYQGHWGLVCSPGFNDTDATVACRQLGYRDGSVLPSAWWWRRFRGVVGSAANRSSPIWMSGLSCRGSELYLRQCVHSGWNATRNCSLSDDVALECHPLTTATALSTKPTTPTPAVTTAALGGSSTAAASSRTVHQWPLRLSQSRGKLGILEVFYNNSWGAVCITESYEDYDATAQLACRQLNFSAGYVHRDDWQPDNGYALADIICTGNETALADCRRSITAGDCMISGSTLVVQCMDSVEDRMRGFRLVDGHDNASGYIQLYVNGSWASLCAKTQLSQSGWDLHDAEVFCRQLGIIRPTPRLLSSRRRIQSSLSEVNFVSDAFNCNGEEPTLLDCPRVQVPAYQLSCGNTTEHAVYAHCESLLN